jgi:putative DNA-invertase from lambdoid prophage Rac
MHTFAYLRVSTAEQTTENQLLELRTAGYEPSAVYSEVVSGKVPSSERPEFAKLVDAIQRTTGPKRLLVTKLDRLGRDAIDVQSTVRHLASLDCGVRVLQLGDLDLTSTSGKLVMTTLAAVAEMERDILVERTLAGLARARAEGKHLGRPFSTTKEQRVSIRAMMASGASVSAAARHHGVSRQTVSRVVGGGEA